MQQHTSFVKYLSTKKHLNTKNIRLGSKLINHFNFLKSFLIVYFFLLKNVHYNQNTKNFSNLCQNKNI